VSGTRLIAVCGYSDGSEQGLHEICARRLRRAEQAARPDDVVLLTGWARGRSHRSEAEQMARSWSAPCRRIVVDSDAGSTLANVLAAARLARRLQADEVILVTSSWHARRAGTLLRAALSGSGSRVEIATSDERPSSGNRLRELACWLFVPFASVAAGRGGRDTRADGV
jgi:uncharacterized SAM-binding protein YcdF (DUF218 family)